MSSQLLLNYGLINHIWQHGYEREEHDKDSNNQYKYATQLSAVVAHVTKPGGTCSARYANDCDSNEHMVFSQ